MLAMENIFFDVYRYKTKTFLLYGNLNDVFFSSDLQERYFEDYLLKCLKDNGYDHVVFYAASGTKGEFWLDDESEKFFRKPMKGPHVSIKNGALSALRDSEKRFASSPGSLSKNSIKTTKIEENNEEEVVIDRRVAYKDKILSEFVAEITPLMQRKGSHMAVVFCNIFNNSIDNIALREFILNDWEKFQEEGAKNICILLATETIPNPHNIISLLKRINLESKFVYSDGKEEYLLPTHCISIGLPDVDEIQNYLKRIYRGGLLSDKSIRIDFRYRDIRMLAREIAYVSKQYNSNSDNPLELVQESLRDIIGRFERFYRDSIQGEYVLTKSIIHEIWNVEFLEVDYFEELRKPGWEIAYDCISKYKPTVETSVETFGEDIIVNRIRSSALNSITDRPPIPHFVLLGNPGTGKTTIARLIGNILHSWDYLRVGHVVEVTKKDLTSSYVAGIPHATMNCVNQAEEGVLFIDEAHLIGHEDGGVNNAGSGKEIISTLNSMLTNPNHHFSLVLAGYEEEMKKVFDIDPGFRSRFEDNIIIIQDYKPQLLRDIMINHLRSQGVVIDSALIEEDESGAVSDFPRCPLDCFVKRIYDERDRHKFGNAREIISVANKAIREAKGGVILKKHFLTPEMDDSWFETNDIKKSLQMILGELDASLYGMERIKQEFIDLSYELRELEENHFDITKVRIRGIVLSGNPGTGKTTLAKLLGQLYYSFGVLGSSTVIQVNASELASSLLGGSLEKTKKYIKEAQNKRCIIFIDEAHQLLNPSFDGRGALQSFLAPMTDIEHPFIPIFAVYPERLNSFMQIDPGLTSRLHIITIEDYTGEQLLEILKMKIRKQGFFMDREVEAELGKICEKIYIERNSQTGNARKIERIIEEMHRNRRRRCFSTGIEIVSEQGKTFTASDLDTLR